MSISRIFQSKYRCFCSSIIQHLTGNVGFLFTLWKSEKQQNKISGKIKLESPHKFNALHNPPASSNNSILGGEHENRETHGIRSAIKDLFNLVCSLLQSLIIAHNNDINRYVL